jgi:hypothetical protein
MIMKRIRPFFFFIAVILVSFQDTGTYSNVVREGVGIEYPSDWRFMKMPGIAILIAENSEHDEYTLETNFAVEIAENFTSLGDYTVFWKNKISNHPQLSNWKLISEKDISFKTLDAKEFVFSCKMGSIKAISKVVVVFKDGKIINLSTTSSKEKYEIKAPITERIFDSIEIQ